jgi:hypothetical protein
MNAVANTLRVLAPSRAARFDPFAASRTTLYDLIGHSIGGDATDKLVADFGGRRLYIPMAPGPGDRITRSIGLISAMAMARMFGGDRLLIPNTSSHARRRVRIVAMRAAHVSISRIAHELRCTERYVYKVLASYRAPDLPASEFSPMPAPPAGRLKGGPINQRV